VDKQDLFQEAQIGVLVALDKFDPDVASKFTNYATYWIIAKIQRHLQKFATIFHCGTHTRRTLAYRYAQLVDQFRESAPSLTTSEVHELIAATIGFGCRVSDVDSFYYERLGAKSLDAPASLDEDSSPLLDLIAGPSDPEELIIEHDKRKRFRAQVDQFAETLSQRDEDLLRSRIATDGAPATLQEIADRHGCCRERVRQVELKLLDQLMCAIGKEVR
jgi:RNA polymerase sigma-32 factor